MLTASLSSLSTRNLLNRTTKGCHYEWHPFIVHTNITTRYINDAPSIYKIILKNLYILNQNNTVTMELTGYSHTQYSVYKNRALLYFAETYQDLYDLVEYV